MMTSQHDFIQKLLDALGLPPRTVEFDLKCRVTEPVMIRCKYIPSPPTLDDQNRIIEELKTFVLMDKDEVARISTQIADASE